MKEWNGKKVMACFTDWNGKGWKMELTVTKIIDSDCFEVHMVDDNNNIYIIDSTGMLVGCLGDGLGNMNKLYNLTDGKGALTWKEPEIKTWNGSF